MDWIQASASLATGIVIAVLSAWLTVKFALRRFYSEKWWERKATVYTAIFEALHHVRNCADHQLVFSQRDIGMPEAADTELTKLMSNAIADLRKYFDIGTFILSQEAVDVIAVFMRDLDEATKVINWEPHLALKIDAVEKCLTSLRPVAKMDLVLK